MDLVRLEELTKITGPWLAAVSGTLTVTDAADGTPATVYADEAGTIVLSTDGAHEWFQGEPTGWVLAGHSYNISDGNGFTHRFEAIKASADTTGLASRMDNAEASIADLVVVPGRIVRPDSPTNDADNIMAALAAAGDVTLAHDGVYDLSSDVDLSVGRLNVNDATLRLVDGANCPVVTQDSGTRLRGPGTIDGNCDNQTTLVGGDANGVKVIASEDFELSDLALVNCRNAWVRFDPATRHTDFRVERLTGKNALDHGYHFEGCDGGYFEALNGSGTDRAGIVFSGEFDGPELVGAYLEDTSRNTNALGFRNEPGHAIPGSRLEIDIDGARGGLLLDGATDWDLLYSVYNISPDPDPEVETDGVNLILCSDIRGIGRVQNIARSGYLFQGCTDIDLLATAKSCGLGTAASLLNGVTLQDAGDGTPNTRIALDGIYDGVEYGLRAKDAVVDGLRLGEKFTATGGIAPYTILAGTKWISSPSSPTRVPWFSATVTPTAADTAKLSATFGTAGNRLPFNIPYLVRDAWHADPGIDGISYRIEKVWDNANKGCRLAVYTHGGVAPVDVEVFLESVS
jgi:hypothetical protein